MFRNIPAKALQGSFYGLSKGGEHVAQAGNSVRHFRSSRHYYSCTYYVWIPSWGGRHVDAAYLRARSRDPS